MTLMTLLLALKNIVVFAGVLSVLIVVHEWGHFVTAKWAGVRVDEFALGFGKTLYSKIKDGTKFMVKAFPLGGYVKMAGDERATCEGKSDEFYSKRVGQRALIVFNGPVINFVLAYVCFWMVFMLGYPGSPARVEEVVKDGPAAVSGLQVGDEIVSVNGKRIYGGMHYERLLTGSDPDPIQIGYERGGEIYNTSIVPQIKRHPDSLGLEAEMRDIGIGFHSSVIGGVADNYPAHKAGLEAGDKIVRVDGRAVTNWSEVQQFISNSPGEQVKLEVLRGGENKIFLITPNVETVKDPKEGQKKVKKIGIGPVQEFESYRFDPFTSVGYAFEELTYITVMTYKALFSMVTGAVSAKESVTGPIGIFYIVNSAANEGISHLFYILAVISASLAIFNLLPVIPLDGGHLFLLGIEKVRGKPLPEKIEEGVARVGFSLIICLAVFVFYSDFSRFGWIERILNLWK